MAKIDKTYESLLLDILRNGYKYEDPNRKGVNRIQISHATISHDFKDGFPALTTKKLAWKSVVGELIWILRGDTNIKYLVDNDINIWNKDAYNYYVKSMIEFDNCCSYKEFVNAVKKGGITGESGNIGRGYGAQLRNWTSYESFVDQLDGSTDITEIVNDQLADLIHTLKTNPMATKKTVTFWNPAEKDQCALTPCHWSFEILVEPLNLKTRRELYNKKGNFMSTGSWGMDEESVIKEYHKEYDRDNIPKYQFTLKWHQHSVDSFLGLPFNIAFYALLAQNLGKITNMVPKGIIGDLSNVHIYEPHMDAVKEQLSRDINKYSSGEVKYHPEFEIATNAFNKKVLNLDEYISELRIDMFDLSGYESYPRIQAEMLAYSK